MKVNKEVMRLYLVTDRSWLKGSNLVDQVEEAIKEGVTFVQLREKHLDDKTFIEEAKVMKAVTDAYHIPFVINDNIEVALAANADGVHVGQSDMKAKKVRELLGEDKIIGVSARTVEEALEAEAAGADYLGVGAVFNTSTKLDAAEVSHEVLEAICKAVSIPVVAIGGISEQNLMQLQGKGADGVAVISAILSKNNIGEATKALRGLVNKMVEEE